MASAGDGFAVSALTSSGSDSGSDSEPAFIDPTNYGQSMSSRTTFGDLTGSRPPAPQEEEEPVLPSLQEGAKDQTLRENIIAMFGPTGDNTLSSLTLQTMAANAPRMYNTYNQSQIGLRNPVTFIYFSNNLIDYLKYRGGRKKQRRSVRRSVIKKRKSMSKKRKNGRKSNKKQRRR
jgi:hypothetical protein